MPSLFTVHLANKACPQHSECQAAELLQVSLEQCSATGKLVLQRDAPYSPSKIQKEETHCLCCNFDNLTGRTVIQILSF